MLYIDETNQLVDIEYDTSTSILCKFLNQQDMNDVSCSIEYKECQHTETTQLNATSSNMPNTLQITLLFDRSDQAKYCYIVTASNSTLIVYVQGTLIHGNNTLLNVSYPVLLLQYQLHRFFTL